MANEKKSKVSILTNGIIKENPVLRLVLGTCSCLAVTTAVSSALGMGAAFTFVLVCSNILISLLRNVIPAKVHLPCYIVIIAGFVTIVQMVMHAYMDSLYTALGVFLPLIVVNCIILGRAEMFACKNNVVDSALDGVGMGIGYTLTVVLMATPRGAGQRHLAGLPGPARQHRPHQHHDSGSRRILLLRRPDGRLCLAGRQAGCAHRAQELLRHRQSEEGGLIRCSSNSLLSSSA